MVTAVQVQGPGLNTVKVRKDSPVLGAGLRSYEFSGLAKGDYRFEVSAVNAMGRGSASAMSNAVKAQ